jgi:hypothetical protein
MEEQEQYKRTIYCHALFGTASPIHHDLLALVEGFNMPVLSTLTFNEVIVDHSLLNPACDAFARLSARLQKN